jgi:hypothetical protein
MTEEEILRDVGGRMVIRGDGVHEWNFGLIPEHQRSPVTRALCQGIADTMPEFRIRGAWQLEHKRYALWAAGKKLFGRHLRYNKQLTGSCVGAGGGNAMTTLMAVEIAMKQEPEEFRTLWWPYTYGLSRSLSGMHGRGEGSTGEGYADAITQYGIFELDPAGLPDLPDFTVQNEWLVLTASTELQWSNGDAIADEWKQLGIRHRIGSAARMRSADDCIAALANGYPLTQASMFGFSPMAPTPRGTPPVRIAEWNGSWSHQTWVDEYWDHPTEGEIFRWGNNWGNVHGSPTGDEPPGGVYIRKVTMDAICKRGFVAALSTYQGFPARSLVDWTP